VPLPARVPRPIRIGAAIIAVVVIAFAAHAYGPWWSALPTVVLLPVVWWALVQLPEHAHGLSAIPFAAHPGQHRVTVRTPGADRKEVVYVVVCSLGVGLGEADRLLRKMPADLVSGISAEVAHAFAARLEAAGAGVTVTAG
jgi:ribosomal protein L7/L12